MTVFRTSLMPSEFMEAPPSSILAEEDQVLPNERKIGFWKTDGMAENYGVKVGGNSLASLSMEKQMSSDSHIFKQLDVSNIYINRDNNYQVSLENNTLGSGRTVGQRLQRPLDNNKGNTPNLGMDRKSYLIAGSKHNVMSDHYENGLFSSSLSDIFSRKLRLSANNNTMYGHSVGASHYEEPFESIEEIEAQTIGNLLPDDDDLLSGVTDGLDYMVKPGSGDDAEEMDVFSSIGGMELGEDGAGQLDDGEHPSRTLLVKNINSDVDDSEIKMLFEQYGEIQTLYTASKHHGFVMISYYDIRATRRAMQALQNKLLGHRKLDIRYSVPNVRVTPGGHMGIPASVSNSFSSIIGMESGGMPSSLQNQLKYDFRTTSNYHPHSLPEYQDGLSNNIQCNSPSSMAASLNARMSGRVGNWQFDRNGGPIRCEPNDNVFVPSGNASSPATQRYMWNASRQPQPQPHNMIWPSSPTLMNGVPSRMANSFLHINNHHVGSAPSVNPSIWDRRNNYAGESPDPPGFHPGSLGNMRVPGNSPHPLDFGPHNMLPRMVGNSMDLSFPTALASHHQNNVIFPSRGQMMPMMSSFDSPSDRSRIRRNEGNSNQTENKKQFELDLDRIMRGEDRRTTLMIKNIPNKYTSKMLLASIDERHRGTYDFIYLPIDFKNKCNVGYAFINMTEPKLIIPFYQAFNGKKWEKFNSEKVAYLAYGRIQGKSALVAHFQNSSLMNEDKRCRPILFHTDGPNAGDQVPFPMGGNVRSRVNKNRNEDVGNTEASSTSSGSTKDFE